MKINWAQNKIDGLVLTGSNSSAVSHRNMISDDEIIILNKANLRDLIAATSPVILFKIGFKSSIFWSMWPSNLMDDLEKQ